MILNPYCSESLWIVSMSQLCPAKCTGMITLGSVLFSFARFNFSSNFIVLILYVSGSMSIKSTVAPQ